MSEQEHLSQQRAVAGAFMEAVPQLISDESIFGSNPTIIQVRSKKHSLAVADFEKNTVTNACYQFNGESFEFIDSVHDKNAFEGGVLKPGIINK